MKKFLIENDAIIKSAVLVDLNDGINYPYEEGWRDEEKPQFDTITQLLGEPYYDAINDVVTYTIISKEYPPFADIKAEHYKTVQETILEISKIVSAVKNVYDPLRTNPENIPADFALLVLQVQALRQRANDEIEALSTPEQAAKYVVRGAEVEGYINQLKSFI